MTEVRFFFNFFRPGKEFHHNIKVNTNQLHKKNIVDLAKLRVRVKYNIMIGMYQKHQI